MEPRNKSALHEKIQALRQTFLDKVPANVWSARGLCRRWGLDPQADDVFDDLHRAFHSIKGTAASFGLAEISRCGATGEALLVEYKAKRGADVDDPARVRVVERELQNLLDRIAELGETAAKASTPKAGAQWPESGLPTHGERETRATKKIYLCDDDILNAELIATQLNCFGYAVTTYPNVDALKAALSKGHPDAVIADIMFPGNANAGTDVMAEICAATDTPLPVVFVSARDDFDARLGAVQAGGQAYFVKPIKTDDLVETLDRLTNRRDPEPYRILVIDDEPEVAEYHCLILQEAGMSTMHLRDPAELLKALNEYRPDLVLTDMYMPRCTGREVAQVIRQIPEFISLPIIFLSVETDKRKQTNALQVGAEGFLTKPIQPLDLIDAVAVRAERLRALRALMVRDGLTGLFNHSYVSQHLDLVMANARRGGNKIVWVMIDVDHFKMVNDTYGHPIGDQVLIALARLLQQRLRHSDLVGRFGGEEFAIVMQNVDPEGARIIVDRLREDFSRLIFHAGSVTFSATFSAGIAGFPGTMGERLIETADQALYAAKHAGRNCVKLATPEPLL